MSLDKIHISQKDFLHRLFSVENYLKECFENRISRKCNNLIWIICKATSFLWWIFSGIGRILSDCQYILTLALSNTFKIFWRVKPLQLTQLCLIFNSLLWTMLNTLQLQLSTFWFKQEHNKNNRLIQEYVKFCLALKAWFDMSSCHPLFRYPFKSVYCNIFTKEKYLFFSCYTSIPFSRDTKNKHSK